MSDLMKKNFQIIQQRLEKADSEIYELKQNNQQLVGSISTLQTQLGQLQAQVGSLLAMQRGGGPTA